MILFRFLFCRKKAKQNPENYHIFCYVVLEKTVAILCYYVNCKVPIGNYAERAESVAIFFSAIEKPSVSKVAILKE